MRKLVTPWRLVGAGLALLGVVILVLWLAPSGTYIFLPDPAHPVAPLVKVKGEQRPSDGGGIYFVDVIIRKASLLERLFPSIRSGASLVPASAVNPVGESDEQRRKEDLRSMQESQSVAAAIALEELGYGDLIDARGLIVRSAMPRTPAYGKLKSGDLIVGVGGHPARTVCALQQRLAALPLRQPVTVDVRRGGRLTKVRVTPIVHQATGRRLLGVSVRAAVEIRRPPFPVAIDTSGVGGPSAGLAFALDLMEELGRDVDHGLKVAVTGTIEADGCVDEIGGVKQKTIGARRTDVDVLLVPAGENAREARRYAAGLRIVPVQSFRQALHALATLPPRA